MKPLKIDSGTVIMSTAFTESVVERAVLAWLGELKYAVVAGPDLAPE